MTLKDKVFSLRDRFKKSKIFYINNPAICDKQYFWIFADRKGQLHYDFADSTAKLLELRKERMNNNICKKYKILYKQEFIKFWFDVEFWGYCMTFADSDAEMQHYKHKIDLLREQKLPLL